MEVSKWFCHSERAAQATSQWTLKQPSCPMIYGRSEELVSRCVECDLAEPESLTSLGGFAPGLVDGILSLSRYEICQWAQN